MGPLRRAAALLTLAIFLLPLANPPVEAAAQERLYMEFRSDPLFDEVNQPVNLLNATVGDTVIGQWQSDLGGDMPNGTFYGSLLPPSSFEHLGRAAWFPEDLQYEKGQYTYVIFAAHFNLTPQQIMSSASEFWLRTPFSPNAVEIGFGLTLGIFEGRDDPENVTFPDYYESPSSGRYQEIWAPRPTIEGAMPDMMLHYSWDDPMVDRGGSIQGHTPYFKSRMVNGRLYLKCNAIIRPSTDYVMALAFRWAPDERLVSYWSTAEEPTGNSSVVKFCDVWMHYTGADENWTCKANATMDSPLDNDWSFVFTHGVGAGGLFGKKVTVSKGDVINIFPFFNTSRTGTQYMSFVVPFISEDDVEVRPCIYNAHGITLATGGGWHTWEFNPAGGEGADLTTYHTPETYVTATLDSTAEMGQTYIDVDDASNFWAGGTIYIDDDNSPTESHYITGIEWDEDLIFFSGGLERIMSTGENAWAWGYMPIYYDYRDFIIWSSNRTLDWTQFETESQWNVMVTLQFNTSANITLLCHDDDRDPALWSDLTDGHYNTSLYPLARPTFYDGGGEGEIMAYDVWTSARGTSGQWGQVSTDSDGNRVVTHAFPQIIHISRAEYWLKNDSARVSEVLSIAGDAILDMFPGLGDAQDAWGAGQYLKAIRMAIAATAKGLYYGIGDLVGTIHDKLSAAWEKMKQFGHWLVTKLSEAIGYILDLLQEAFETLAGFWDALKYVVAPAVMVLVIGLVSAGLQFMNPRRSGA